MEHNSVIHRHPNSQVFSPTVEGSKKVESDWSETAMKVAVIAIEAIGSGLRIILRPLTFIYEWIVSDTHRPFLQNEINECRKAAYFKALKEVTWKDVVGEFIVPSSDNGSSIAIDNDLFGKAMEKYKPEGVDVDFGAFAQALDALLSTICSDPSDESIEQKLKALRDTDYYKATANDGESPFNKLIQDFIKIEKDVQSKKCPRSDYIYALKEVKWKGVLLPFFEKSSMDKAGFINTIQEHKMIGIEGDFNEFAEKLYNVIFKIASGDSAESITEDLDALIKTDYYQATTKIETSELVKNPINKLVLELVYARNTGKADQAFKKYGHRINNPDALLEFKDSIKPKQINDIEYNEADFNEFSENLFSLLVKIVSKDSLESISKDLDALLETEYYKATDASVNLVNKLIESLGAALISQDPDEAFKNALRDFFNSIKIDSASPHDKLNKFLDDLQNVYATSFSFNRNNGFFARAAWALCHPDKTAHASIFRLSPKHYDAELKNNTTRISGIANPADPNTDIPMALGPTLTDMQKYNESLRALEAKGTSELRFVTVSGDSSQGENVIAGRLFAETKKFQGKSLHLVSLPFDMDSLHKKSTTLGIQVGDAFSKAANKGRGVFEHEYMLLLARDHLAVDSEAKNIDEIEVAKLKVRTPPTVEGQYFELDKAGKKIYKNRLCIPEYLLTDEELKACYSETARFFSVFPLSQNATPEEQIKHAKSMQLFLQATIVHKITASCALKGIKIDVISIACRQCIDRGAALIAMVKFIDLMKKIKDLSEKIEAERDDTQLNLLKIKQATLVDEFIDLCMGFLVGRPQDVDRRISERHRTQLFIDFLRLVIAEKMFDDSLTIAIGTLYSGLGLSKAPDNNAPKDRSIDGSPNSTNEFDVSLANERYVDENL